MTDHLMKTYARLPVSFVEGRGVWLHNDQGEEYLDALSGIGVCALGHAHPEITRTLSHQAGRLVHTSNLYHNPGQEYLADRLADLSGMDRVFFANSGAEAVEAAIKIARLYGHAKGIDSPTILVAENSFHGRTMATLSATGNRKVQAGFEPLVRGFARIPFGDIEAVEAAARHRKDIVGILIEPIQGEGGIVLPPTGYLAAIRSVCDDMDWLMMLDEIQTGIGRTGHWFAHQSEGIKPDVMTLAKALANGFPIGACLAQGKAAECFHYGHHGSTFGGNPLACAVAAKTLECIEQEGLLDHAAQVGTYLLQRLQATLSGHPLVADIRGRGLMIGIELNAAPDSLMQTGIDNYILFSLQAGRVIRLLPPLILTTAEADEIVLRIGRTLSSIEK